MMNATIRTHHTDAAVLHNMDMHEMSNFRANLAALLEERGWTMVELERRSRVSRTQITLVLRGERQITVKRAAMIAGAFGLDLCEMLRSGTPDTQAALERRLTELFRQADETGRRFVLSAAEMAAHESTE